MFGKKLPKWRANSNLLANVKIEFLFSALSDLRLHFAAKLHGIASQAAQRGGRICVLIGIYP